MRLIVADDHTMFLHALSAGLTRYGHEVVGSTDRLEDLAELVVRGDPDMCLLDLNFGRDSVLAPVATIRAQRPDLAVVLLSGTTTPEVWAAVENRLVDGVVSKTCDLAVLDRALQRVAAGEVVIERFRRPTRRQHETPDSKLTRRERAVVSLLVEGASTDAIAEGLDISRHTVRTHIESIMRKLEVTTRAKIVQAAVTHGGLDRSAAAEERDERLA